LGKDDLIGFDKECRLFTKRDINSSNVNNNLHRLALLNMPNGGLNIEKYIVKLVQLPEKEIYRKFIRTNTALIELLVNGIVPLNAMRFNHNDIKAGNILMSEDGHARLIDWGLAGENDGIHIPETIQNRSIAFNMPFSDIFFDNFVKKWLPEAFKQIKGSSQFHDNTSGQSELLKIVAVNMINKSIEKTSEGHYDYIMNTILHDIYKIYAIKNMYNRLDYNVLSNNVLVEYVHAVLLTYVDENGHFNDTKYFYEVFTKNVDIWGFLLAYVPIIEFGVGKFHIDLINAVCRILLKYCFSAEFAVKPIVINELVLDLQSLNDIQNVLSLTADKKESLNKMSINKMSLNKMSLNKMSLNKISNKKHNISL
jgi:serine/threonine protein kinase